LAINKKENAAPVPYLPATWEPQDATALQCLVEGKATAAQQKRAMNWIIYGASNCYDLEYRNDSRDHAFASGRRFVGLQMIKLLQLNIPAIVNAKENKA